MKTVYALLTHEPDSYAKFLDDGSPSMQYATREIAEAAAEQYNEQFIDPEPAEVVEVDVAETMAEAGL